MNKLVSEKGNGINVFGFFRDYYDLLANCLTEQEAEKLTWAIVKFVFEDVEPTFNDAKLDAIFRTIQRGLTTSKNRAKNAKKKEERVLAEPEQREKGTKQNQKEIKNKSNENQKEIKNKSTSLSLSLSLSNNNSLSLEKEGMGEKTFTNAEIEKTIVDEWNKIGLSQVQSLSKSRKDKIRLRVKEQGLERVLEAFKHVQQSSFLMGDNKQGWKCSFDWIFSNDSNIVKVLEGNYEEKVTPAKVTGNVFLRSMINDKMKEENL